MNINPLEDEFYTLYPNKKVRGYYAPKYIDLKPIMQALEESSFLRVNDNLNIKWLIKNRDKVLSGKYKDFSKDKKEETLTVSPEELQKINKAVEESDFLKNAKNLNMNWLIKNKDKVLSGAYKTYNKPTTNNNYFATGNERTYTQEDYDSMWSDLDNINWDD